MVGWWVGFYIGCGGWGVECSMPFIPCVTIRPIHSDEHHNTAHQVGGERADEAVIAQPRVECRCYDKSEGTAAQRLAGQPHAHGVLQANDVVGDAFVVSGEIDALG